MSHLPPTLHAWLGILCAILLILSPMDTRAQHDWLVESNFMTEGSKVMPPAEAAVVDLSSLHESWSYPGLSGTRMTVISGTSLANSDPATAAGLLGLGALLKSALDDLAPALGFQGSTVVGQASQQLSTLMREFEERVGPQINQPLNTLGFEIQNMARQLQYSINGLNWLVDKQRQCGFQDMGRLLAGFRSMALHMADGIPLGNPSAPRFEYYQFDGNGARTVPENGGQATLVGYRLWPTPSVEPFVKLVDRSSGDVVMELVPAAAGSVDEVSVMIPKEVVDQYAGRCLSIEVIPRERAGFIFRKTKELGKVTQPLCVPEDYNTSVMIKASARYSCPTEITQRYHKEIDFYFENHTNDERNESKTVTLDDLSKDCTITGYNTRREKINRGDLNATFSHTATTITANAHLDDCYDIFGSCRNHSVWSYTVLPVITCKGSDGYTRQNESTLKPIGTRLTTLQVDMDEKQCNFNQSEIKIEFWRKMDGPNEQAVKIHETAWIPANINGATPEGVLEAGNLKWTARFTPGAGATIRPNMHVEIEAPTCSY